MHPKDALGKRARKILVRTVDTDVVVILTGVFFHLEKAYPDLHLWVSFGTGKYFKYYFINEIFQNLGGEMSSTLILSCLYGV